jgi:hypothetical protein
MKPNTSLAQNDRSGPLKNQLSPNYPFFNDDLFAALCLVGLMNDDGYQQQLEQLKIEHRALDDAIRALTAQTLVDQLQIARLKKKKLILKDRIMRLEDQLVPDILA